MGISRVPSFSDRPGFPAGLRVCDTIRQIPHTLVILLPYFQTSAIRLRALADYSN